MQLGLVKERFLRLKFFVLKPQASGIQQKVDILMVDPENGCLWVERV